MATLRSYFLTLRDKFRYKLLSVTVERMLSTAGIEPRVRSIRQQVESTTPSWLLVFHLYFFEQVKNQLPRWCSGLNLLLYALNPRFDPCCAQHSFRCCTKQLVSELVSQCYEISALHGMLHHCMGCYPFNDHSIKTAIATESRIWAALPNSYLKSVVYRLSVPH